MTTTREAAAFLDELVDADILDPEAAFELRVEAQRLAAALREPQTVGVSIVMDEGLLDDVVACSTLDAALAWATAQIEQQGEDTDLNYSTFEVPVWEESE